MKFSDETLMAYADGELDAETRRQIEASLSSDEDMARKIAEFRALRTALTSAYSGPLDEPVPAHLIETALKAPAAAPDVADLASIRTAKTRARQWTWREWTSIAASLFVGVLAGHSLLQPADTTALIASDGRIAEGSMLEEALFNLVGSDTADGERIRIALSFRSRTGEYCRSFAALAPNLSGIACRDRDGWHVRALAQRPAETAQEEYRMAGTPLPAMIVHAIETSIDGDPLNPDEELAARRQGWR